MNPITSYFATSGAKMQRMMDRVEEEKALDISPAPRPQQATTGQDSSLSSGEEANLPTLAFASISTDDFKFDPVVASDILSKELDRFFPLIPATVRVVLVDPMKQLRHELLTTSGRLIIAPSTGAKPAGLLEQNCSIVAVGCNKLLKAGGDRLNIELHRIFGAEDELNAITRATMKKGETLEIGKPVCVRLDPHHPVSQKYNVSHVIHVLGPNFNPLRLDCLKNDYVKGRELLGMAYRGLFACFARLVKEALDTFGEGKDQRSASTSTRSHLANDNVVPSQPSGPTQDQDEEKIPPYSPPSRTPPKLPGLSLLPYLSASPATDFRPFVWFRTKDFVVIYDGYPKARCHSLVIPLNQTSIKDIRSLRMVSDGEWIRDMHRLGEAIARKTQLKCQIGYHALPSLTPLHLHVISTDFNSPRLTTKKHWNSFTHPNLFIHAAKVAADLKSLERVQLESDEVLHAAEQAHPQCYVCGYRPTGTQKDMIAMLKTHKCPRTDM